jgi:tyrosine-protein kinase Etk/Wzc
MEERISLLEMLRLLLRNRRVIVLATAGATAIAVVVSLVIPSWYEGVASILPPEGGTGQADMAMMMRSAGFKPAFIPGVTTESEVYAAILRSTTVIDAVIDSFDLQRTYGFTNAKDTRERVVENLDVSVSDDGIVTVAYEDKDKTRAAAVANGFVRQLDTFNQETLVTSARRVRQFIEGRTAEARRELEQATEDLKAFKTSTGVVLLSEQATASIETAAKIYGKIAELEVSLERLRQFATERSPEVIDARSQIRALERKLAEMGYTGSSEETPGTSWLFPRFNSAPEMERRLADLMMEVEIKGSVFKVLSEQYEQARIEEMRDTPTIQTLDWATEPMVRSKPKRKVMVAVTAVSAFLLASMIVLLRERRGALPPADREALSEIGSIVAHDTHRALDLLRGGRSRSGT